MNAPRRAWPVLAMLAYGLIVAPSPAAGTYAVSVLSGGADTFFAAARMSDTGFIAGSGWLKSDGGFPSAGHAYLFTGGTLLKIDPLAGDESNRANGVNNDGVVVGTSVTGSFLNGTAQAFQHANDVTTPLGALLGHTHSEANAVNNHGQAAGSSGHSSSNPWGNQRAALFEKGLVTDLGTLDNGAMSMSLATGINDAGQVVGASTHDGVSGELHAVLFENGLLRDLTPGAGIESLATDINSLGQVVGLMTVAETFATHAFLWDNGVLTDLGTLSDSPQAFSNAGAINDAGWIVGTTTNPKQGGVPPSMYTGFVYFDGQMYDLNDLLLDGSEWTIAAALDISNNGDILAFGVNADGEGASLLLTNMFTTMQTTPEPGTLGIAAVGVVGAFGYVVRRRRARGIAPIG